MKLAMRLPVDLPDNEIVRLSDGRRLCISLRSGRGMYDGVYFFGEYEPAITQIVRGIVRPGDVCLDVGANLGWYTTLMCSLCGNNGKVHAFEPVPFIFRELQKNVALSECTPACCLNMVAVGNSHRKASMHVFEDLPNGHSSLSTLSRGRFKIADCTIITLNEYIKEKSLAQVDIIKCDAEGAELWILQGAGLLFRQKVPPIWIIEMAKATLSEFGCAPNDIILYMKDQASYRFYAIDELRGRLKQIDGFNEDDIGANVLCLPEAIAKDRLPYAFRMS
jgi:FkbM family methyltransferase